MRQISGWIVAGVCVLLCGLAAEGVRAQGAARPAGPQGAAVEKKVLAIKRMPRLNKIKQPTPQYSTSATRTSAGRPREWGLFEVEYETVPEWLDEVVATYYVMAERRGADRRPAYTFYQTTVRYKDVARGEHTACAVLPPAAVARYGDQFVAFAVEFAGADGALLAVQSELAGVMLQPEWWKKPDVTESKSVVKRDDLVDRSKTPFALVNPDDYEVVK
jgi:hypothetical protein